MESAGGKGAARPHGHHVREALAAALVLLGSASVLAPTPVTNIVALPTSSPPLSAAAARPVPVSVTADEPRAFYDDPSLSYAAVGRGQVTEDWDSKRPAWLRSRGLVRASVSSRVVMVSGSQPEPCRAAGGDHLLLRFLKNKLGAVLGGAQRRRCQWSLDLMDAWARMGPAYPRTYARWGQTLRAQLAGKTSAESDDQSALVYLLPGRWGNATLLETGCYFQGYWAEVVDRRGALRRRHAEREHLRYAAARNAAAREAVPGPDGGGQEGWRRPFVTHFTGCNPCGGQRNPAYSARSCRDGMRRALAFADDQVLRAYGVPPRRAAKRQRQPAAVRVAVVTVVWAWQLRVLYYCACVDHYW
jgi:hypothetical protein